MSMPRFTEKRLLVWRKLTQLRLLLLLLMEVKMFSMLVLKLDVADAKYSEERLLLWREFRGLRLLILF